MKFNRLYALAAGLMVGGVLLLALSMRRNVTVLVDGSPSALTTSAFSVGSVLRAGGIRVSPGDRVQPGIGAWLMGGTTIRLERAFPVQVWIGDKVTDLVSAERLPANLLSLAGQKLFPGDSLYVDGQTAAPDQPLSGGGEHVLQLRRALPVTLVEGAQTRTFYSSAPTLGQALWEAGVSLTPGDRLEPGPQTPLTGSTRAVLQRAVDLQITVDGQTVSSRSAAPSVGQALAEAGIALQGLDTSQPAEDAPLPADGNIRVVRVREEVVLQQTSIPFETKYEMSSAVELDQRQVIGAGQTGLVVSRVRVRYEDGKEVARQAEGEWTARAPKPQIVGIGTQVVIHTTTVDGVTIQYWRAVTVYATSYSPCNLGTGSCGGTTASGAPVRKGVVAVTRAWYNQMAGQQIYVPGYGQATIADIGGGVPGQHWIDLGFSDSDYTPWHSTVTIYFLAPAPANIPWTLP